MRKIVSFSLILAAALTLLASCSQPLASGRDGFLSPSVIFDEFDKAKADFLSVAVAPSYDAELSGQIEWKASETDQTDVSLPDAALTGSYRKESGAFIAAVETYSGKLGIYNGDIGLIVNSTLMDGHKYFKDLYSQYLNVFCGHAEDGDFKTLADNIRVSDVDEEVSRITLTLPKERAAEAVRDTVSKFKSDLFSYDYVCSLFSLFAEAYGTEQNGRQLLENTLLSSLSSAADNISGDLVWTRYVKNGRTVSERLTVPVGENTYDIFYTCTVYDKETEFQFVITENSDAKICDLYALFRRGDISNTYRIQANIGRSDYGAAFIGEVKKAYKSGSADMKIYRSGDRSKYRGSMRLYLSYDATRGLKYTGEGNITVNEKSKDFTLSLVFTQSADTAPPEKPAVTGNMTEFYETLSREIKNTFPDVREYFTGE